MGMEPKWALKLCRIFRKTSCRSKIFLIKTDFSSTRSTRIKSQRSQIISPGTLVLSENSTTTFVEWLTSMPTSLAPSSKTWTPRLSPT